MKGRRKWEARCRGKRLGYYATEEAAARAYNDYVKDGVDPVTQRAGASRLKGVHYNKEIARIGRVDVNVIPPAGDADYDDGDDAPAALALLSLAASTRTHAGAPAANAAGSKAKTKAGAGAVAIGVALVGRKVKRKFDGVMYGGRVASFDPKLGWYRVAGAYTR